MRLGLVVEYCKAVFHRCLLLFVLHFTTSFLFLSGVFCIFGMAGDSVSHVDSKQDMGHGKGGVGASPGAGVGAVDFGVMANIFLEALGPIIDQAAPEVFKR